MIFRATRIKAPRRDPRCAAVPSWLSIHVGKRRRNGNDPLATKPTLGKKRGGNAIGLPLTFDSITTALILLALSPLAAIWLLDISSIPAEIQVDGRLGALEIRDSEAAGNYPTFSSCTLLCDQDLKMSEARQIPRARRKTRSMMQLPYHRPDHEANSL